MNKLIVGVNDARINHAPLSPGPIHYSRGLNKYDNTPVQHAVENFDAFEAAVLGDRAEAKGLQYVCSAFDLGPHRDPKKYPGHNHWRNGHLAVPRIFQPFDCDGFRDADTFGKARAYWQRFRGFGYTTASHTETAPRARIVLALNRPVGREEGIRLGYALQAAALQKLGADAIQFDASVYKGEQPLYLPLTASEVFIFNGALVDVDAVLVTAQEVSATKTVAPGLPGVSAVAQALAGDQFVLPERIEDGEGRESLVLKYAGHLRAKRIDQAIIERTLLDYNQLHIFPPLAADVVLDRARRFEAPDVMQAANDSAVPEPQVLAEKLPPVHEFVMGMLPKGIGAYVQDVAERMSCPVDFPAVAAMVALALAVGARVQCKPYAKGTWMVPAGLWGMVVANPGGIKSPPLSEMLRPLAALDKLAAAQNAKDVERYQIDKQIYENAVKAAIRGGTVPTGLTAPVEPTMTRYVVNDSTYEMLVAIAAANPNGFLIWRDELVGWFHSLNKENQKEARGLYLTGWTGTESYATDRIGRGHVRAERVNLSLLGTIQPNVLRSIVYDAVAGGAGDDGLVSRFQLGVYPDPVRTYVKTDRYPDLPAMQHYKAQIQRLVSLQPASIGASIAPDGTPYLTFDDAAQQIFDHWRQELEERIRATDTDEHPAMLSHLGKYRSLFPKLALVLHLAAGKTGPIGGWAANRALAWTIYLEAHARRIYHTATNRVMQSAVTLANKIKAGKLQDRFTKSDVLVKEWAGLRTADEVASALTVLCDGSWLTVVEDRGTGGRPALRHTISPKVKRAA